MLKERSKELLDRLKRQGLTAKEIEERLNAIIDAECSLPEGRQNQELVDACVDLQWFLATGEHYKSNREEAKKKLDNALREREARGKARRGRNPLAVVVCTLCFAALLMVLPATGQNVLHRRWIEGETVAGGEVYRLNGAEVDPGLMKEAIAEIKQEDISIVTSDYEMLSQLRVAREMHPRYIPEGWKGLSYNYTCIENVVYYVERYGKEDEEKELLYKCVVYPDAESAVDDIQQNEKGDKSEIGNRSVYFTENYDMLVAAWSSELISFSISAPLEYKEMIKMVSSIGGD